MIEQTRAKTTSKIYSLKKYVGQRNIKVLLDEYGISEESLNQTSNNFNNKQQSYMNRTSTTNKYITKTKSKSKEKEKNFENNENKTNKLKIMSSNNNLSSKLFNLGKTGNVYDNNLQKRKSSKKVFQYDYKNCLKELKYTIGK